MSDKRFTIWELNKAQIEDNVELESYICLNEREAEEMCELLNELHEEKEQLQSRINDYDVALKTLQDLTEKKLKENKQLKQLLDYADDLIQSHSSEHFIRQWRNFKTGHKEYNDFWEEKLKKHKELKGDVE